MTKYILHGGATRNRSKSNRNFFREMIKGINNPVNVLCIYFAKEEKARPEVFSDDKNNFFSAAPQKTLSLVMASDRPKVLIKQIKGADVIYMRGGKTALLKKTLIKVKNFAELIKGKVVSGSSAGAYILSKYYLNSEGKIDEGFGILPIKTFAHYTNKKFDDLSRLKKYGENLKIYKIPEEKFIIIKQ